jgi:hypothetical protein
VKQSGNIIRRDHHAQTIEISAKFRRSDTQALRFEIAFFYHRLGTPYA